MAVYLSPVGGVAAQFFDNDGNVLSGGKIYTYTAGSSTPAVTYTNASGAIPHSNPIILNSAGRVPSGEIWLTDGITYKFVINNANDVLIGTYDNVNGINSNFLNFLAEQEIQTATANQTVFTLTTTQYQPGTNTLLVFVDGVNQYGPGAQYAYTETSSTVVTFTNGLHVGASVKFTTTQALSGGTTDASLVTYTPPFTGGVQTTVEAKLAQYVSVKDFGAVGDGTTDDTNAIQAAIDSLFNSGGGTAFLPSGNYRITAPLELKSGVSLNGDGISNCVLSVEDCNAIELADNNNDQLNGLSIRNFRITCTVADNNIGIKQYSASLATWWAGLTIEDMSIERFSKGVSLRNTYWVTIENNDFMGCHIAVNLEGQNRVIKIINNRANYADNDPLFPPLAGSSIAVYVTGATFGITYNRPEDVLIQDNWFYRYDYGVDAPSALLLWIINNDFDFTQIKGIQIAGVDGAINITGNWVAINNVTTGLHGIDLIPLGVATNDRTIVISGNNLSVQAAIAGQAIGVKVGAFQTAAIENNTISGFTNYDIYVSGGYNTTIRGNYATSVVTESIYIIDSKAGNIFVDGNYTIGFLFVHPSNDAQFVIGANTGTYSTYIRGKSVIANGTNTTTTLFSSLPSAPPDFKTDSLSGVSPILNILYSPSQGLGYVTGLASTLDVVITCQNNATGNQTVYWDVVAFANV
jgi:hypothetical protein